MTKPPFEADLDPRTKTPRIRFNFGNGWTASVVMRKILARPYPCDFEMVSLACWPTGRMKGNIELGETEASPEEMGRYLTEVAAK